jgi:formate-dependent phosphoribosylglycinamide formyltransferase (GAR transformylase)
MSTGAGDGVPRLAYTISTVDSFQAMLDQNRPGPIRVASTVDQFVHHVQEGGTIVPLATVVLVQMQRELIKYLQERLSKLVIPKKVRIFNQKY